MFQCFVKVISYSLSFSYVECFQKPKNGQNVTEHLLIYDGLIVRTSKKVHRWLVNLESLYGGSFSRLNFKSQMQQTFWWWVWNTLLKKVILEQYSSSGKTSGQPFWEMGLWSDNVVFFFPPSGKNHR